MLMLAKLHDFNDTGEEKIIRMVCVLLLVLLLVLDSCFLVSPAVSTNVSPFVSSFATSVSPVVSSFAPSVAPSVSAFGYSLAPSVAPSVGPPVSSFAPSMPHFLLNLNQYCNQRYNFS